MGPTPGLGIADRLATFGRRATVPTYAVCFTWQATAAGFAALGLLGVGFFLHETLALFAPINILALKLGFERHRTRWPLVVGSVGALLVFVHVSTHFISGDFFRPDFGLKSQDLQGREIDTLTAIKFVSLPVGGLMLLVGTVADLLKTRAAARNVSAEDMTEHWRALLSGDHPGLRAGRRLFGLIPASPRCKLCNAPFSGGGGVCMRAIGKTPSDRNPLFCGDCYSRTRVGGAEVELSLLFADVRGSTPIAERMGAGEFGRLIDRYFNVVSDVLVRSDALIERLVGDGVVALFVPGYAGPDHARKATRAAQDILQATGYGEPEGPWLPIGVGVHTGVAFVGVVGSTGGMKELTTLGDAPNTTARLSGAAAAGEVLVSEAAAAAAGLDVGPLEHRELQLKGKSEPFAVRVIRVSEAAQAVALP